MSAPGGAAPWWRRAVVYEVYPRSFADSDGDGEGDLRGLTGRLPYLAELGVDAVWVAPWYPSPLADGGYDVTDYRDIHPMLGTLDDADELVRSAHGHGLRVVVDMVANHTSSEHPWFREALGAPPGSPPRARYLFRDGRGRAGERPPNNWRSAFGGPAWTRVTEPDGAPGQWYLHTFAPEQPDLDWSCEEVLAEFDDVLRFWLDRGIDGIRVDAAPAFAKDPALPDADYGAAPGFVPATWVDSPHWDLDATHDVLRRWRAVLDGYPGDRMFVAEAVVNGPERLARYLRPGELHTAINFDYLSAGWDPADLRTAITATLRTLQPVGAPPTWALSSHDETRHLTRFARLPRAAAATPGAPATTPPATADLELGERRARASLLLTLALPGGAYLYQGEELGLPEVEDLPDELRQDPSFARSGGLVRGRDGCRVPLPWSGSAPPYGFSPPGTRTWLPQPATWAHLTVEAQRGRPGSMLEHYREALALRRRLSDLHGEDLSWLPSPERVLHFRRGERFRCVLNLGAEPCPLGATPALLSEPLGPELLLPPDAAAWLVDEDPAAVRP